MRILAGADFHGNLGIVGWFVEQARALGPEAVALAGDLLGFANEVDDDFEDQRRNAQQVVAKLLEIEAPIFFIMGNDDLIELEPIEGRLTPVHNRRAELEDFNFVGYQHTLPFMGGDLEKPEEEIEKDLEAIESLLDDRTVFVTHSPAYGILDPGAGAHKIGSRSLRTLLDRTAVRVHIHGHSHSGFGREGIHFNVASARSNRAMLIDLETLENEALTD